jgi:hypothetical protein
LQPGSTGSGSSSLPPPPPHHHHHHLHPAASGKSCFCIQL